MTRYKSFHARSNEANINGESREKTCLKVRQKNIYLFLTVLYSFVAEMQQVSFVKPRGEGRGGFSKISKMT